ncbi:hypothetical protein ACFR9U_12715 [Halorientalis brevis]|uniref:DUF8152 domain-containing protein n=1 Tax=Halorientalis brevis TaxID=1126241 RepID=A0ABD6CBW0_9EURY|nr:hypothetical protein [Halorientalis brevis]
MDVPELTAALYRHLAATEQLPLDPVANRWLGEAQAVAADIATSDVTPAVAIDRAATVVQLLESTGDIDNPEASEHVATSLTLARELAARA